MQRDDVPFHRGVLFDGSFFSASGSWVPIVDAEPLLFCQAIGHIGVKAVFLNGWRVCLTKGGIGTVQIDQVAF